MEEFITQYLVANVKDVLNYTVSGLNRWHIWAFSYCFPSLGIGNWLPPVPATALWVLASLQSWVLDEQPEHSRLFLWYPSATDSTVIDGISYVPSEGSFWRLPMAILCLNPSEASQKPPLAQNRNAFPRAVWALASLAFYLLLSLWSEYPDHPLLVGSPEVWGSALLPAWEPWRGSAHQDGMQPFSTSDSRHGPKGRWGKRGCSNTSVPHMWVGKGLREGGGQWGCAEAAAALGLQAPMGASHCKGSCGGHRLFQPRYRSRVKGLVKLRGALAPFHAGGWRRGRTVQGSAPVITKQAGACLAATRPYSCPVCTQAPLIALSGKIISLFFGFRLFTVCAICHLDKGQSCDA